MGKGKKKTKGKKRDGEKTKGIKAVAVGEGKNVWTVKEPTQEQHERAIEAAVNRTEDPLKHWTRLQNEECPICMIPLPLDPNETGYMNCCGKLICSGCILSHIEVVGRKKMGLCVFCRVDALVTTDKAILEQDMKLANTGNGEALRIVAGYYFHGKMGLQQDKAEGLKWLQRALEAGCGKAAYNTGVNYLKGDGVEQDEEVAMEYFQKAADLGSVIAFYTLGNILMEKGEIEEAMLNYRKAAICGMSDECEWLFAICGLSDDSIFSSLRTKEDRLFNMLRKGFKDGYITRDEYALTLRENQAACNDMQSEARIKFRNRMARS